MVRSVEVFKIQVDCLEQEFQQCIRWMKANTGLNQITVIIKKEKVTEENSLINLMKKRAPKRISTDPYNIPMSRLPSCLKDQALQQLVKNKKLKQALLKLRERSKSQLSFKNLMLEAMILERLGKFRQAQIFFQQAKNTTEAKKDSLLQSIHSLQLSKFKSLQKQDKEALQIIAPIFFKHQKQPCSSLRTDINFQYGFLLSNTGQVQQGLKIMNQSIAQIAKENQNQGEYFRRLQQLGKSYRLAYKNKESLNTYQLILKLKKERGFPPLSVAQTHLLIANSLSSMGSSDLASQQSSLALKLLQSDSSNQSQILKSGFKAIVGQQLNKLNNHGGAIQLLGQSYSKRKQILGPYHQDTCQSGILLGQSFFLNKDFDNAQSIYQQLKRYQLSLSKKNHHRTANICFNLGTTYLQQKKYDQAADQYQFTLQLLNGQPNQQAFQSKVKKCIGMISIRRQLDQQTEIQ